MYSELIYTRCGEGIDLVSGNKTRHNGFKVYACSAELLNDSSVDVRFLAETARLPLVSEKDPHKDIYMYVVPEVGDRFLLQSHAVEQDRSSNGFFSRRGGNYLNQLFVGTFDDLYPFETFGDDSVWDAKKRGEAYYYNNASQALSRRRSLVSGRGIHFEDVGKFIADGRRNVLMKTVAFLIEQYNTPYENRKYLLIKEKSKTEIEMWIAAIECAFSQRISSGISFATHLDGAVENRNNVYSVNPMGRYSSLQDNGRKPSPNRRIKAMIVGVEEAENRKPIKESDAYVVLDGATKMLSCETDSTKPVFNLMTAFNDRHRIFTQGFLQSFNFTEPKEDVLRLYVAFTALEQYEIHSSEMEFVRAASFMLRHKMKKTPYLSELYLRVKSSSLVRARAATESQQVILNWMQTVEKVLSETD